MASNMTPTPVIQNIALPRILGYYLNASLFGILVIQAYLYFVAFPGDRAGIKALVCAVVLLETLQSAMLCHDMVVTFGLGFSDVGELLRVQLSWFSVPILGSVVASIVQIFFAWRIHVINKGLIVSASITMLSLLQLGAGVAQGVLSLVINDFKTLPITPLAIWLVSAAVCDITIAVAMTWALKQKQSGSREPDMMITRIMRLTIETGSLTAFVAVLCAALHLAEPNDNYFVLPSMLLGKLYANNLVMIFNSRMRLLGSSRRVERSRTRSRNISTNGIIQTEGMMSDIPDVTPIESHQLELQAHPFETYKHEFS